MCWKSYKEYDTSCQKAETDIEVYKLVLQATENSCVAPVRNYKYNTNTQPIVELTYLPLSGCINEGYHSYINVKYEKDKENNIRLLTAGLIVFPLTHHLKGNYLAKFIIPKGSLYYKNIFDEVVSNRIRYTGEYYKLIDYSAL